MKELAAAPEPEANRISDLKKQFGDELAGLLLHVSKQQPKAHKKLSSPFRTDHPATGIWWGTNRSVQQATPWQVARLKSNWTGKAPVLDICCGMAGDAVWLAGSGPVTAVDKDPLMSAFAEANLMQHAFGDHWKVQTADASELDLDRMMQLHIDPDRREGRKRSTELDSFSPNWPTIRRLVDLADGSIMKVAPASLVHPSGFDIPIHRCWISLQGTVREQTILVGASIEQAGLSAQRRSSISLNRLGQYQVFESELDLDESAKPQLATIETRPRSWMVDPVSSIRAAGLTGEFAARHLTSNGLAVLGKESGFLTASEVDDADELRQHAVVGKILWEGSADDRKLRRELRSHNWYPIAVKCRGTDHDPNLLQQRYRKCGETPIRLWLGRAAKRVYAVITD